MADEERGFVISVRQNWLLWTLASIATAYFLAVVLLNVLDYTIQGVSNDMLVLGGVGLFALVLIVELPFFLRRRRPRAPKAAPVEATEAGIEAPAPMVHRDDELRTTTESQQGLQVLEYSAPAKSTNPNAVYTKTYVPVTTAHVVRVETLVADAGDI